MGIEEIIGSKREENYLGLNLDRIWEIVTEDLPPLQPQVASMIAEL